MRTTHCGRGGHGLPVTSPGKGVRLLFVSTVPHSHPNTDATALSHAVARASYELTARTVRFLGGRGEQRPRRLIDEFFSGIKAGRVIVLEEQEIEQVKAGELTALVTSALPLTEDEQKVMTSGLAEQLG